VKMNDYLNINCIVSDDEKSFTTDYVLIATGRKSDMSFLNDDIKGNLNINGNGSTNIPGLYFAGDVRRDRYRQTGIAVGDGILCGMLTIEYLNEVDAE